MLFSSSAYAEPLRSSSFTITSNNTGLASSSITAIFDGGSIAQKYLSPSSFCGISLNKTYKLNSLTVSPSASNISIYIKFYMDSALVGSYNEDLLSTSNSRQVAFTGQSFNRMEVYAYGSFSGYFASNVLVDVSSAPVPLQVLSVSPANGRTNVGLNDEVVVTFNQNIKNTSNSKIEGVETKQTISNNVLTLKPLSPFNYDTSYNVRLSGVSDLNGKLMADYVFSFRTVKDTTPLIVKNIKPPPDSVDVPLDTNVEIEFNKSNIDVSSLGNVKIDGVETTTSFQNGIVILTIKNKLEHDKQYIIHIEGVKDVNGNGMLSPVDVRFSTVKDTSPLQLLNYKPPSGVYPLDTTFEFVFSKILDMNNINFILKDTDGNSVSCSTSVVGGKIIFSPVLQNDKSYVFTFLSAKDLSGNIYDTPVSIDFQTMKNSGNKDFDEITSSNLKLFSGLKDNGFNIVKIAVFVGIIFIGGLWLWRKLNYWMEASYREREHDRAANDLGMSRSEYDKWLNS